MDFVKYFKYLILYHLVVFSSDRDMLLMGYGLLFGGVSVVQALSWSFLYLVNHPDVVCNMQTEIDNTIGKSRCPTWKDKPSLPYCQAVLYEILRISSAIPVAPTHVLTENIQVNGYTLPKGAWVLLGLCTVNWDSSIFPEPEKFNPGRFINDSGQLFGFEKVYASYSLGNNLFKMVKESFKSPRNFQWTVG